MRITAVDVMREVRSFFPRERMEDRWQIRSGRLTPDAMLLTGDWVAVTDSLRNDGVYQVSAGGVLPGSRDEVWDGAVWLLAPPKDFLALCEEIGAWTEMHEPGTLKGERFGEYSREAAVDANGVPIGWREVFAARLAPWRRMFSEVNLYC